MTNKAAGKSRIVKTPIHNIPIGEPIKNDDGRLGLRMKKQGELEFEDVWIDQMFTMVAKAVND